MEKFKDSKAKIIETETHINNHNEWEKNNPKQIIQHITKNIYLYIKNTNVKSYT